MLQPGSSQPKPRFFYCTREFAAGHLIPAYLKSDDAKAATENHCFNLLQEKMPPGKSLRPLLTGFAGGTGEQCFDLSLGALDHNYPCWAEVGVGQ